MRSMRGRVLAALLVFGLVAAACSNSGDDGDSSGDDGGSTDDGGGTAVDQPGVTDTEIKVGGVVTLTNNPLGTDLNGLNEGVEAYFAMINDEGGIYGRDLVLDQKRDDALANNTQEMQALVQSDIFAAIPLGATLFTGADVIGESGIPAFGWNVNPEWAGHDNLFNQEGALCFDCAGQAVPWLAQEVGAERVAALSYNVPQSSLCVEGIKNSLEEWPTAELAFEDTSISYGNTDYSAQVSQMKDAGVDFVAPCIDQNGVLNLAREMRRQGLEAQFSLPNAYDHGFMEANGEFFEGAYVRTRFAPLETDPKPESLAAYQEWMDEEGFDQNEYSLIGWILADMFVTGLELAGEDFTQQKVIDELNQLTDYNADGLLPGLDWTKQHEDPAEHPEARVENDCYALTQVQDKEFVPVFTEPDHPFICLPSSGELVEDPENK